MSSPTAEARLLGDFALGDKLGEGGFGTVYRARQRTLDRDAVIKVMRPSLAARKEAATRFQLEAKLAARFDHPYAAHVYAFGAESDGLLWIAMELVRGTPLGDLVAQSGPLPLERFVPLMERLCEVIQAAHDQGIVHRDIKPSNVMIIARSGRLIPKLLDFGIAKAIGADEVPKPVVARARASTARVVSDDTPVELDHTAEAQTADDTAGAVRTGSLTLQGQILGSPMYMAPEQWLDASTVGPWTDQYALAMLAYEVLTGARPFKGTTLAELAVAHVNDPLPALPDGVPAAVHAVLARAAAKDPRARFGDLGELAAALRAAALPQAEIEEVVELPAELYATWSADAPRPIAEAIAAIVAARSPSRIADRVAAAARTIARWIGVVALASRSRLGKLGANDDATLVRDLRRRALREDEWLDLAATLTRPYASRAEAWPVPELVGYLGATAVDALRALVRGESPLLVLDKDTSVEHQTAVAKIAQLTQVLGGLGWLLDYEVAREVAGGLELWMGQASDEVVVRAGRCERAGQIVLLDADGARAVALSPLVEIAAPAAGEAEQMFVVAGPGRTPDSARFVAPPRGFERDAEGTWSWLASHVLEVAFGAAAIDDDERPPYPGLAAFTSEDHGSFVGREREIEELVNRLRSQQLVAVVGPSGVGKSSFLAAGLVPALPTGWTAELVRPGGDPLAALAALVDRAPASPYRGHHRSQAVSFEPEALAAGLVTNATQRDVTLVVVIDQAEELFTMCSDDTRRTTFATALALAARSRRIRVVLGLRDDFLCRIEDLAPWRGELARTVQILRVPALAELERIVAVPARRRGYEFDDPTLPHAIASELVDRPGALPLVAFAATELWEQRDRHFKRITRAAYDQIGGVRGALVQHADGVVDALAVSDRRLVRLAFRRLLTADGTRALTSRADLIAALGGTPAAHKVVERLLAARLIVSRDDDAGDRVEIVHEALITTWPRLATWRREDDADITFHEQLVTAARHWDARGRAADLLWRGDALADLRRWRARSELTLTPIEAAFADASERAWRATRRRRTGAIAAGFAVLASGVVGLGSMNRVVSRQRGEAVHRLAANLEERGRLAIETEDPARGLLFLTEARKLGSSGPASDLLVARATAAFESETAVIAHSQAFVGASYDATTATVIDSAYSGQVWDRATRTRIAPAMPDVFDLAPAGDRVVAVTRQGDVVVTSRDGAPRWRVTHVHESAADNPAHHLAVAVNLAGNVVLSYGPTGRLWNLGDGKPRGELHQDQPMSAAAFDPSGRRVVTADMAGAVAIWDATTGARIASAASHAGRVRAIAFSPDGATFATVSDDRTARICDATTGAVLHQLEGHTNVLVGVAFSPDGKFLATGSRDATVRLWNTATGALHVVLAGHHGTVLARFSPDGHEIVTSGQDDTVRIWDVSGGTELALMQSAGASPDVDWDADGRGIVIASVDGSLRHWDVARARRGTATQQHAGMIGDLVVSRDGRWSASAGDDGVAIWDLAANARRVMLAVDHAAMARFSPDGTQVVAVDGAGTATIWSIPDGTLIRRLSGDHISAAGFAPDGATLFSGGSDGIVRLWNRDGSARAQATIGFTPSDFEPDPASRWVIPYGQAGDVKSSEAPVIELASARIVTRLRGEGTVVVAAGADRVALGDQKHVQIYESTTWRPVQTLEGQKADCVGLYYLPDGRLLALTSGPTAMVWGRDGHLLAVLTGDGNLIQASAVARDGSLIALGGHEGKVRVFDATTYRELYALPSHVGASVGMQFTPDSNWVLSAGVDGRVVRWDVRHPSRPLADLTRLVRCRVPLRFDGDAVLPRELDFDDPTCRDPL